MIPPQVSAKLLPARNRCHEPYGAVAAATQPPQPMRMGWRGLRAMELMLAADAGGGMETHDAGPLSATCIIGESRSSIDR